MRSDFSIILKQFVKFSNGNLPDTKIDSDVFESACCCLLKEDLIVTIEAMKVAGFVENFDKIGGQIEKAHNSWPDAQKQLHKGKSNLLIQTEQMKRM